LTAKVQWGINVLDGTEFKGAGKMDKHVTGLTGKVALVTGGSRGIGAAIARRLAAEGAAVVITYANSPQNAEEVVRAINTSGGKAKAIQADSADAETLKRAVQETVKHFGGIDILVNNAGVAVMAPLHEFSLADYDRTMAINVRAVFVAAQEASRHMRDGGRIINIGSVNADTMPFAGGAVYGASKAAVQGLTRGLARDLGARNITVNTIQPGPVDTDMNPAEGQFAEMLKGFMALKRYGTTNEIAGMVAYLAGPEAGFITGAALTIDGGFGA
jgi:3-oxoacyl-[acyl-carrier protein] reductase